MLRKADDDIDTQGAAMPTYNSQAYAPTERKVDTVGGKKRKYSRG
jgi:hypothetical protein